MQINGKKVTQKQFAYDGCHKIYLLDDETDVKEALACDYEIHDISKLQETFYASCGLRFIHNWKLTKTYVNQFDNAIFSKTKGDD